MMIRNDSSGNEFGVNDFPGNDFPGNNEFGVNEFGVNDFLGNEFPGDDFVEIIPYMPCGEPLLRTRDPRGIRGRGPWLSKL